ncbi:hypothetical protein D9M72_609560 [compost metagenome]
MPNLLRAGTLPVKLRVPRTMAGEPGFTAAATLRMSTMVCCPSLSAQTTLRPGRWSAMKPKPVLRAKPLPRLVA